MTDLETSTAAAREERAPGLVVEYATLTALLAVAVLATVIAVGGWVSTQWPLLRAFFGA